MQKAIGSILGLALLGSAATMGFGSVAHAQNAFESELAELHMLCDRGERRACIRFGMMLERRQEHAERWRQYHPEWFWWDR